MINSSKHVAMRGFTIVELLVVVVVIAILATITIVSYNGVVRRAEITGLQSSLRQASTKLALYNTDIGSYPEDLPNDVSNSADIAKFSYTRTSNNSFCLSAGSTKNTSLSFHMTESGTINDGYCVGHPLIAVTQATCFAFNSVSKTITNYYDNEDNSSSNPVCPRDISIPSSIGGVAVTSIGISAFKSKNLTSVIIPNSITSIARDGFSSNSLTSVVLPNSITSLSSSVFRYNQLNSVTLSNSLTAILTNTFAYNKLTSITIPNSVMSIAYEAFTNNQLTSASIPTATIVDSGSFDAGVTITRY